MDIRYDCFICPHKSDYLVLGSHTYTLVSNMKLYMILKFDRKLKPLRKNDLKIKKLYNNFIEQTEKTESIYANTLNRCS